MSLYSAEVVVDKLGISNHYFLNENGKALNIVFLKNPGFDIRYIPQQFSWNGISKMNTFLEFPPHFRLQNLAAITARVFALKANPHHGKVDQPMRKWFKSFEVYNNKISMKFMDVGRFDIFATLGFPDADLDHLKTCLAFFLWAFSTDDRTDEGLLQCKPDDLEVGAMCIMDVVKDPLGPIPRFPNARMLQDLMQRISRTASPGTIRRFGSATRIFTNAQIQQARNRSVSEIPSVEEFISMRRATIGAALVEAMVEYSLDLDIPDHVFDDPIFIAMSEATTDIMTWPNDLCSFNKEQLDGDYQNLVCCIMVEHGVDLQSAVDILTAMVENRVSDYTALKSKLPSFGSEIDKSLAIYHRALEHFVQGTIVWYYVCPRYFSGTDSPLQTDELEVNLYVR